MRNTLGARFPTLLDPNALCSKIFLNAVDVPVMYTENEIVNTAGCPGVYGPGFVVKGIGAVPGFPISIALPCTTTPTVVGCTLGCTVEGKTVGTVVGLVVGALGFAGLADGNTEGCTVGAEGDTDG